MGDVVGGIASALGSAASSMFGGGAQAAGGGGGGSGAAQAAIAEMREVMEEAIQNQAEMTKTKVDLGTALNAEKAAQNPTV